MFAGILLVISVVALGQFTLYYWRALLAGVAAEPVLEQVRAAAGLEKAPVGPSDFRMMVNLHKLAPELKQDHAGLGPVRAYYTVMEALRRLAGSRLPLLAVWADHEMALCSRYAAVRVGRRLESNQACAAEIWS